MQTKTKNIRVNLWLDPAIAQRARLRAAVDNTSLSALVEKALEEYLPGVVLTPVKGDEGSMKISFVADNLSQPTIARMKLDFKKLDKK